MSHSDKIISKLSKAGEDKIKIIMFQGCSSSGKSTLATYVYQRLKKEGVEVAMIACDNYYKTFPLEHTLENIGKYDFDNPASLNWDGIKETLSAYAKNEKLIPIYSYSFITKISQKSFIENNFPKVIIFEGIYSFNLFNNFIFNINQLNPFNSDKIILEEFIENDFDISRFFPLKIQLKLNKEKMKEVRIQRDIAHRKFDCVDDLSVEILKNETIKRFETKLWPATQRWVYSNKNTPHIIIEKGSFNIEICEEVCDAIFQHFELNISYGGFKEQIKGNTQTILAYLK